MYKLYKDKKTLLGIAFAMFAVLLATFLFTGQNSKMIAAVELTVFAVLTCLLIKKRGSVSVNKKEALFLSTILSVLYVILIQLIGLATESYKNPYFVNAEILLTTVIPLAIIIVASEIIRYVLLAQKNTVVDVISYAICVIAESLMLSGIAELTSMNHFMDLVGLMFFPALSANIFYHYVSKRFGALPNIVYRLISVLYVYFLPIYADLPDALFSCIKLFTPIILLALFSALFEKQKKNAVQKGKKLSIVGSVFAIVIVVSVTMIISCQFRFGAIVIATESMTGEINKGDMIVYEEYDGQPIEEGQVVVFLNYENKIVHRVIKIERIGEETRYYTKGDANNDMDAGYITDKDIVGLTDFKVSYIGFPTLWLRELLESS